MILALILAAISVTPAYTNINRAGGSLVMTNIQEWASAVDAEISAVDGAARQLPSYLHALDFNDSYTNEAAWYYAQPQDYGGCSAVRDGGFLHRNYDWKFDDAAEFVVRMSAGQGRFASVGVANCGTNLTEVLVTSGKPSRYYKCLPGRTVDGINENGVVCEVNVVDGTPPASTGGDIHPLGAVRWALDNGTAAEMVATTLVARIMWPVGWRQNFHWMIADERETWIVENGTASNVTGRAVMTNFPIIDRIDGMGLERWSLLNGGANITNAWYTRAYHRETNPPWVSDLRDVLAYTNDIFDAWAAHDKEYFRGKANNGIPWWQTVHTSIYDITNRTLRICVQEQDDWYTFAVPSAGGVKPDAVREIVSPMIEAATNGLRRVDDLAVYASVKSWVYTNPSDRVEITRLPVFLDEIGVWSAWGYVDEFLTNFLVQGSPDATHLVFTPVTGLTVVFDLSSSLVPTSDRLATTNGVAEAISGKLDKTGGTITGAVAFEGKVDFLSGGTTIDVYASPIRSGRLDFSWLISDDNRTIQGELDAKRDLTNNVCAADSFTPWVDTDGNEVPTSKLYWENGWWCLHNWHVGDDVADEPEVRYINATFLKYQGELVATRSRVAVSNELFVTQSFVTNETAKISAAKQDALPYPTNAVPWIVIANPPDIPVIDATDPTFSNAVLAVQIDTNAVAQIGELKQFFDDLPTGTVGTSLGGILLAILSAVAALKKSKADKTELRYDLNATSTATMADRTTNALTMTANTTLVFPAAVGGKCRDFILNLAYTAGEMTLPTGITKVGDELSFTAGKNYLIAFTEIAANKFYVRAIELG